MNPYGDLISPSSLTRLLDYIQGAKVVSTVTHSCPDGDAIGSSLGMYAFLEKEGKDVVSIFPDKIAQTVRFIVGDERILDLESNRQATLERIASSDLIICLDFNSLSRSADLRDPLIQNPCPKILVDHHQNPNLEEFDLVFSDSGMSSASEYLFHILMACPQIDGDASRLPGRSPWTLMCGMTTDTNNFSNSATPSTFWMASQLLAAGVDRDQILVHVNQSFRENRVRMTGHILKDLMTIMPFGDDEVAYFFLTEKDQRLYGMRKGEAEGIVNIPLTIERVKISISAREEEDRVRLSIRSKKGYSARLLAEDSFGGGGHDMAAGGTLMKGNDPSSHEPFINEIDEVIPYIRKAVEEHMEKYHRKSLEK